MNDRTRFLAKVLLAEASASGTTVLSSHSRCEGSITSIRLDAKGLMVVARSYLSGLRYSHLDELMAHCKTRKIRVRPGGTMYLINALSWDMLCNAAVGTQLPFDFPAKVDGLAAADLVRFAEAIEPIAFRPTQYQSKLVELSPAIANHLIEQLQVNGSWRQGDRIAKFATVFETMRPRVPEANRSMLCSVMAQCSAKSCKGYIDSAHQERFTVVDEEAWNSLNAMAGTSHPFKTEVTS